MREIEKWKVTEKKKFLADLKKEEEKTLKALAEEYKVKT